MAHRADPLTGPATAGPARSWALLGALALLEACWLVWFLAEPLPNAQNAGGSINRAMLLARALPEIVPGVSFHESYLGRAAEELGHAEYLPQRGPIVLAAALIAAAAIGLGLLVLRGLGLSRALRFVERLPLAYSLGTVGLSLASLALGRLGRLDPWPIRIGLGLLAAWGGVTEWGTKIRGQDPPDPDLDFQGSLPKPLPSATAPRILAILGFTLVVGPFLAVMALGAMLPTIEYDALEYHLQGPKEYYQTGRITFLPHNVYTSMPFGVEMLHLLGMVVLGDWWRGVLVGQLVVMLHAPAAAAMVALTARRWGSPRVAWIAAAAYLTTPWIHRVAVTPFVEGPLCLFHAALIWVASRAWVEPRPGPRARLWGVAGAMAGGAMACKYPALVSAVVPFGFLALAAAATRRSWPIALAFGAGLTIAVGPWLAKNVADTGNPVYPLAYRIFGGQHWDATRDTKWSAAHRPKPISARELVKDAVGIAGRSDWQSPLFASLAPLALLRPGSRRMALALMGYTAYLFATWWLLTHRLERFWLPMLPPLAILAGLGADWSRHGAWSALLALVLTCAIASNLTFVTTELAGPNQWAGDLNQLRAGVLATANPPLARLDAGLPPTAKILLVGQASVFHIQHAIVYNTVFNDEMIEVVARGRTADQVRRELARLGVTHIYVDWSEIQRYRSRGNYGFTPFVAPELFAGLVRAGVLGPPSRMGVRQELYAVRSP